MDGSFSRGVGQPSVLADGASSSDTDSARFEGTLTSGTEPAFPSSERGPLRSVGPYQNFGAGSSERTVIELRGSPTDFPEAFADATSWARAHGIRATVLLGSLPVQNVPDMNVLRVGVRPTVASMGGDFQGPVDADDSGDLARLEKELAALPGPVVLLSTCLEQRRDPRVLLRFLKRILLAKPSSYVVLTGIDRPRNGSPPAANCFRQWSAQEAAALFSSLGFRVERVGPHTARSAEGAEPAWTAVLSYDRDSADAALRQRGLPASNTRSMVIASASAPGAGTSGAAAYMREALTFGCEEPALRLLVPSGDSSDVGQDSRWLRSRALDIDDATPFSAERFLALTEQALVEFPDLDNLRCHDRQGLAACVVQANQVGQFPPGFSIEVVAVGTQPFLERSQGRWEGYDGLKVANDERASIEGATALTFCTSFLEKQYREIGYHLPERSLVRRLPALSAWEVAAGYEQIDTLVFFGNRDAAHGFPVFAAAVGALLGQAEFASRIKTVLVLGATNASTEADSEKLRGLLLGCEYIEQEGSFELALNELRQLAPRALCVLPYLSEALPHSVLDAVATGCQVLASSGSGISELLPTEVHGDVLVEPTAVALESALATRCRMSPEARRISAERTLALVRSENERVVARGEFHARKPPTPAPPRLNGALTVVVPCFNTPLSVLSELVWSLNQQTLQPARVIFVDDGSSGDLAASLARLLEEDCRVPYLLVRHGDNRGLPAARNTGLAHVETMYVANLDSDDIAKNDYVGGYTKALDENPSAAAVTSFLDNFVDGRDWHLVGNTEANAYRPQGHGLALAQVDNCLAHQNSAYRVDVLRRLGGWDAEDRSMYEDYALHIRLVSEGHSIGVVPRALTLYRVRADSMLRTYSRFEGEWRLGRNLGALERFDGLRLQSLMRESRRNMAFFYDQMVARGAEAASLTASFRSAVAAHAKQTAALQAALAARADEAASLRAVLSTWGWDGSTSEPGLRPLRYRLVDRLNRRLQGIPGLHQVLKWVGRVVISRPRH